MKIRLCEHNKGSGQIASRLQTEFPDLNVKIKKCVKQCKVCKRQCFALVDKQPVISESSEDLYTILLQRISVNTGC
jgi:uncharacterized protein YuzB (UPF0349 family)